MKQTRFFRLVICLLIVLGVVACGSNKKKELKPNALTRFDQKVTLEKRWSKTIGKGLGKYYQQFIMAQDGDYVYAASVDGEVYKLNKLSGKLAWKVTIDNTLTSGVAVDDKQVYVGTLDGAIVAINKESGKESWSQALTSEAVSAPASNNDAVIVQTINGQVFSLDSADGDIRWRYDSVPSALTVRGNSRPQFFSTYVAIGLGNGKLAVLSGETGQLMWEPKIADPKGDTELSRVVDVDSTPLMLDSKLIAASYQGKIAAYDLKTGRLVWSADESTFRDLGEGFNSVYVANVDGTVNAYDINSGDIKWSNDDFMRRKVTGPVTISSYLVVADFDGYLHVLSQVDGQEVGRKKLNGSGIKAQVLVNQDWVYAIANNGKLVAYQLHEK